MESASPYEEAKSDLASLVELDPSPIESPTPNAEHNGPLKPTAEGDQASTVSMKTSPVTSLGLRTGGHGAVYYLMRIQRYSSYTLSVFTAIHLVTTSVIPLATRSGAASESYLLLAREIYQTPLSEPLLVALPAIAHVASGLGLRLVRRSHNMRRYGEGARGGTPAAPAYASYWPPLSPISASGYAFAVLVGAHVLVNRALPVAVEGDSANIGLAFVAHGFARHPVIAWASYAGLLAAACGHIVWGWAKWLGVAQRAGWRPAAPTGNGDLDRRIRRRRRRVWFLVHSVAAGFAGLWAAGGLGVVARGGLQLGWVGKVYDGLFDRIPGL